MLTSSFVNLYVFLTLQCYSYYAMMCSKYFLTYVVKFDMALLLIVFANVNTL